MWKNYPWKSAAICLLNYNFDDLEQISRKKKTLKKINIVVIKIYFKYPMDFTWPPFPPTNTHAM